MSYVKLGLSETTLPELKRFASGNDWNTLTNPGAPPRNVFCGCVSTESHSSVPVRGAQTDGRGCTSAYPNVSEPPTLRRAKSGNT